MKTKTIILNGFMLLVFQLFFTVGNAQIEYFNFSPDTIVSSPDSIGTNYYNIDLDIDGLVDFRIGAKHFFEYELTHDPLDSYLVIMDAPGVNRINTYPCLEGDTIHPTDSFSSSNWVFGILPEFGNVGPWPSIINSIDSYAYIGLEFHNGDTVNYGWVRMKTDGYSFTIDEYAWNQTQGQFIIAGQTE